VDGIVPPQPAEGVVRNLLGVDARIVDVGIAAEGPRPAIPGQGETAGAARRYPRPMASGRGRALLRFFLLGAALLAGERWLEARSAGSTAREIAIGPAELAALRAEAAQQLGREPDPAELEGLVQARVDDEILWREALARGLDREDEVVRRRLVRNLAFLRAGPGGDGDAAPADEVTLYREALALGMDRTDTVVRRRLVQRMTMEVEAPARAREPSEAELHAWLDAHPSRRRGPRRVAFRQVFFDPARRGARAEADASAAVLALAAGGAAPAGDPCLVAAEEPLRSESLVERLVGPGFADALFGLPLGAWAGPVRSSLGWHAVRVEAREAGAVLPFAALRAEARDALLAERAAAALERFLAERRPGYPVRLAGAGS
jgi:hypothetical protein